MVRQESIWIFLSRLHTEVFRREWVWCLGLALKYSSSKTSEEEKSRQNKSMMRWSWGWTHRICYIFSKTPSYSVQPRESLITVHKGKGGLCGYVCTFLVAPFGLAKRWVDSGFPNEMKIGNDLRVLSIRDKSANVRSQSCQQAFPPPPT